MADLGTAPAAARPAGGTPRATAPAAVAPAGPGPDLSPFDPLPQRAGAAVRGGAVAVAGQGVRTAVRLVGTVALARLLTPADFGLVAMVTVVTGFVGMFTDVGLSAATVQRPKVTHEQVSTLFWLNVTLGCALAALTAACSPLVAWFYGEPRLTAMTAVSACGFVLAGFTVQHGAILRRRMRFHLVTAIGVAGGAAGTAAGVALALLGWGVWSLVVMGLVASAVGLALTWAAAAWLPGRPVRRSGVREMLRFGGWLTGFQFLNYGVRNGDNLLIGAALGAGPLGLYSRAYGLLMLPISQVSAPLGSVAVPALSRLTPTSAEFRDEFRRLYRMLMCLALPVIGLAVVLAEEAVTVLLGEQWTGAVPVFRVLALAAVAQPVGHAAGWLFVAAGRAREMFLWGVVSAAVTIPAFLIGSRWGIVGVAWGYAAAVGVYLLPLVVWATWGQSVRPADFVTSSVPEFCAAVTAAGPAVLLSVAEVGSPLERLLGGVASGVTLWGLHLWASGRIPKRRAAVAAVPRLSS